MHKALAAGHDEYSRHLLTEALIKAHQAFANETKWEVIGSDSFKPRTGTDTTVPANVDGFFHQPTCLARPKGSRRKRTTSPEPDAQDQRREPLTD